MGLTPRQAHLLKSFVNRKRELERFRQLLDSPDRFVMLITGQNEIGKSALLSRIAVECNERQWAAAEIACDRDNVDYLSIMRRLVSALGRELFDSFIAAERLFSTGPSFRLQFSGDGDGAVSVGAGASFEESEVGEMVGVKVEQLELKVPPEYLEDWKRDQQAQLTHAFISDLAEALRGRKLVILFDAIENMPRETEKWVAYHLIGAMLDGPISNMKIVQCGERKPASLSGIEWTVLESELLPLGEGDVAEYLSHRGMRGTDLEENARKVVQLTGGLAGRVARLVDSFQQQQRHDD